ncbi:MAG: DUF2064 domain-containing protein [Bdellovibrionales bacterium]|jgi:uncharacterized protein|nr:DUF2064 domain-containing protein [Bdellovibrionales bacterium]
MQDFAIAVFVKTPEQSPIKTRLAKSTNTNFAKEFYIRSVEITKEVVLLVQNNLPNVSPYWAVAEKNGLSSCLWSDFEKVWQGDGDLGDRLSYVYNFLKSRHRYIILIGADSPLILADHLTETFEHLKSGVNFVLGPAYDGGFYLFGASIGIPTYVWKSVEYSNKTTKIQLMSQLQAISAVKEIEVIRDIDSKEDIFNLLQETESSKTSLLPCQTNIIRWMSLNIKKL